MEQIFYKAGVELFNENGKWPESKCTQR